MVEKDRLLRLLRENKVAAFSAVLILIFVLAAVFAPFLAPYDPKQMDITQSIFSGQTREAGIFWRACFMDRACPSWQAFCPH